VAGAREDPRSRTHLSELGQPENLVAELAKLTQLLADHPCFYDGARLTRISPVESPVYGLLRESEEGVDQVLVLINNSPEIAATLG